MLDELTNKEFRYIILNNTAMWMNMLDKDTNVTMWNKAAENISGYSKEEVLGNSNIWELLYPDEEYRTSIYSKALEVISQGEELTDFETTILCKDGSNRVLSWNTHDVKDESGDVIGSIAIAKDMTESKQVEDELKRSASVFRYASEGIVITDIDNNIIDVNQAFVDITGFSHSEVLGKNPNILQSGRNDKNFYIQLWNTLKEDGVWQGEVWNRKKSGEEYLEHLTITAVTDENKVVQNYVALFTDITLQRQQQEELKHIAHYDILTNLPNRVLFYDRMNQAVAQASRREKLISVVYIDLDGFKEVNDTYGHYVGDKLLILMAERMNNILRQGDTISRVGGDEFIALLIDITDKTSVISFVTRLLEIIAEPVHIHDLLINVSASIGVTYYPQNEELDIDQIIKQADEAMYLAKLSGKNCYFVFNPEET